MNQLDEAIEAYEKSDYAKAYELFYPLAAYHRNDEAQLYMGMIYFHGDGVEKNIDTACEWWKKAMRNGNVDAANRLSEIKTSTKTMF